MIPYDTYRSYQIERPKSRSEIRRADEQAGYLAAAVSRLLHRLASPARASQPRHPAAASRSAPRLHQPAARLRAPALPEGCRGTVTG
jgi:hypothetical protein